MRVALFFIALALFVSSAFATPVHLWERQAANASGSQTVYDFISSAGNYTLFTRLLAEAPQIQELLSDPNAKITLFVPFDQTTAQLAQNLSNPQQLLQSVQGRNLTPIVTPLLAYHIANGTVDVTSVQPGQNETVETVLRYANLSISNEDGQYKLNDAKILDSNPVNVSNGVVYPIQYPVTPLYFLNITTPQLLQSLSQLASSSGGGGSSSGGSTGGAGGATGGGGGSGGGAKVKRDFDLFSYLMSFAPKKRVAPLWRHVLM